MDYQTALTRLEALRATIEEIRAHPSESTTHYNDLCLLYGEVEDIIHRFGGIDKIEVTVFGRTKPSVYPNYIEAGYLSGRTFHQHQGYTQLLKIIGKVRQAAADPHTLPAPPTLTGLLQTLRRFRECCQYIQGPS